MTKLTPEQKGKLARMLAHKLCSEMADDAGDVHLVVLRKECGQCGQPASFVSVAPDIHQFLCYACTVKEWGREWADAALKMERMIDDEEAKTGKKWRPQSE
jgi:hypothetical protein